MRAGDTFFDKRLLLLTSRQSAKKVVSDLMYNWVAQRPAFKNAVRVIKKVQNTQCYQYLWLTMWFHAKKLKETLKNQNRWYCYVNLAPELRNDEKFPKKPDQSEWYILDASWWILMSRLFRRCVANGGRGNFRPTYRQLKFTLFSQKREAYLGRCKKVYLPKSSEVSLTTQITSSHSLWEEVITNTLQPHWT